MQSGSVAALVAAGALLVTPALADTDTYWFSDFAAGPVVVPFGDGVIEIGRVSADDDFNFYLEHDGTRHIAVETAMIVKLEGVFTVNGANAMVVNFFPGNACPGGSTYLIAERADGELLVSEALHPCQMMEVSISDSALIIDFADGPVSPAATYEFAGTELRRL